jgi:hypothetical protein
MGEKEGEEAGVEPNHTTARKLGSLKIVQPSITEIQNGFQLL